MAASRTTLPKGLYSVLRAGLAAVVILLCATARAQVGFGPIREFLVANAAAVQREARSRIDAAQAQEIFHSVDEILKWASGDTGLPIKAEVKRELATRDQMQRYSEAFMAKENGAEEVRRSELLLKKLGLLPRDFQLQPFLLKLLREQVLAFYAPEKKTVYLLDWVEEGALKPVLAHELTHALQDQAVGIERWTAKKNPTGIKAGGVDRDREVAQEEPDAARHAVLEGQGMIAMLDYVEEPRGQSALSAVDDVQAVIEQMTQGKDSPVFRSAPLYLRESLTFPYRYGMQFERDLLSKGGKQMAFGGALAGPPQNTREVMEPRTYLQHEHVAPLPMPELGGIFGERYEPLLKGPVGEFDVHMIIEQFGKSSTADRLAREWRGGYYVLAREKTTPEEKLTVDDVKLVYVSRWSDEKAAEEFFQVYARAIPKKYPRAGHTAAQECERDRTRCASWTVDAGEVTMLRDGNAIAVTEGFSGETAGKIGNAALRALGPQQ